MQTSFRLLQVAVLASILALSSAAGLLAATPAATNAPAGEATKAPASATTNTTTTITKKTVTDADDSDFTETDDKGHSIKIDFDSKTGNHSSGLMSELLDNMIPLAGIAAVFGTPVLIVFFIAYFNFKRRRENLIMAREYLNKGMTVPPELLGSSFSGSSLKGVGAGSKSDLSRGLRLTFIGLGVSLALYINSPHSTTWGWGLIPAVMGVGFIISGWIESRNQPPVTAAPASQNPDKPL